ncbi:MAG: hypothetical protein HDQ88_07705 [Clostridia bacterium]|nr:hypothetical protein [Clostridia bacterium]
MRNRTKIIWIAVCLAVMVICIILGVRYNLEYLIVGGVVFCAIGLSALGIIIKIKTLKEINHELKMTAEEGDPENVGELIQASFGFTKDAKERFKKSSVGDKLKVIALFGSLGLLLLTMAIGVAFANAGTLENGTTTNIATIGFILMGIGGGGFFLEIILLIVISKIIHR